MTIEERAEKIASQYCNVGLPEIPHIPGKCPLADDIAAEIRAAVQDAENELKAHWFGGPQETDWGEGIQTQTRAEAFEEAAKIAGNPMNPDYETDRELILRSKICSAIRDRAKEVAK